MPAALVAGCSTGDLGDFLGGVAAAGSAGSLSSDEAAQGIKAALEQGVASAIAQVGRAGGFLNDPTIRIPLPDRLAELRSTLGRLGLAGPLDELEVQLNRGAERAAPQARSIFIGAIRQLTVEDALSIVRGGPTSATDYFRRETAPALRRLFTPVMTDSLEASGAIRTYDRLSGRLDAIPLAPDLADDAKQGLIDHGVERALQGLFTYIAEEEAAIRANPAKRSSEILRRVFG